MNMYRALPAQKHVLFILRSLRRGGTEKCTIELAKALSSQGYIVHLALRESVYELETPSTIHIHEIGSRKQADVQHWLSDFNQAYNPSLVIVTETRIDLHLPDLEVYYALHIVPSERIDGGWLRQLKKRYQWRKRLSGKNIIAISKGVYQDVMKVIKAKPKSICVINNTFDFEGIANAAQRSMPYPLPSEYLLYVGRICTTKRLDRLLRIYRDVSSDLPLVVLGDGDTLPETKKLAEDMKIADKVIFLGWQSNPYPVINQANALLLTSDSESFSAVVVESLFLSTPVISTDCQGPKEIMGSSLKDFVIPKQNEAKFARQLQVALEQGQPDISKELIKRFGFAAISHQLEQQVMA